MIESKSSDFYNSIAHQKTSLFIHDRASPIIKLHNIIKVAFRIKCMETEI